MAKDMFVWRKSVYDNHFKCNACGAKLFSERTNTPTDNLVIDDSDANADGSTQIVCYCGKCSNAVATWQSVGDVDIGNENVLQGSYSEWLNKKAVDVKAEVEKKVEDRLEKKYKTRIDMLNETIKSREATIKKLKEAKEKQYKELDEQNLRLHQELRHAYNMIETLQDNMKKYLEEKERD